MGRTKKTNVSQPEVKVAPPEYVYEVGETVPAFEFAFIGEDMRVYPITNTTPFALPSGFASCTLQKGTLVEFVGPVNPTIVPFED